MHLNKQTRIQLAIFTVIALVALILMGVHYMKLPVKLFGIGHYSVTMQLPVTGGLYGSSNVTYRGTEVGRVDAVRLTDNGVVAEMTLNSDIPIPSDLRAEVHSQSAIGEQYVELLPRSASAPPLKDGDVIALADTSVPQNINDVLDAVKTGLEAVPRDNLKTVIDESYTAVGGLGPELTKIVSGAITLSNDARDNLDPMLALIDNAKPVLDSQTETSDAIQGWASHVATVTRELQEHDRDVAGVIDQGGPALNEVRQLVDRVQPTLPVVMANLASVGQVGLTYQDSLEQILVLLPQLVAIEQGSLAANVNTKQDYKGAYLSFNLNLNLPPPCTTGYLPTQQARNAALVDYPDRAPGDLYCRVPQDSPFNVRGVRNTPCVTRPGKRAATVRECESDTEFVPLNDGFNWKGDPNATGTGQAIPQLPPPPATPPPIAVAYYDPATGAYIGPDGKQYTQSDLAQNAQKDSTWETLLLPPGS
ncbi:MULTISPECIES: MCE family protein [Mycobacteriaceae]|uniref:Mammalian cell entry protein n=1 Tax=Mycolicibacterium neoaurum VKM Ac-1815D TaxID=700508 RepID=V5XCR4_MYCNE|nr:MULTISPECIES: MlaD family protein [Mycobacteriaceae]AHC25593.1 mammalian cell entry protein [Mycolicibacterium neoaurum VKM Ac-1815D]AMO06045.1 mammalian cell entry protein [Mycolicibacterium neoaurum]AXK75618.1 MCE family protein [Mycolicibacterium neoaurum]KJQ50444.1 mammalian cell entry protein [Mycolicibacterium neoaurum]KUM09625.1 mammalian cell entry protein [Mycolicibacterium neoaurum]